MEGSAAVPERSRLLTAGRGEMEEGKKKQKEEEGSASDGGQRLGPADVDSSGSAGPLESLILFIVSAVSC